MNNNKKKEKTMRMFEKLHVGTAYRYATDDELKRAQEVYDRYVEHERGEGHGDKVRSFAEFLLEDVEHDHLESFLWDKGQLVKTQDGKLGMTTGWTRIGFSRSHFAVSVKTASGNVSYLADALTEADVPPEVLEYVKSTLQDKVHDKVDEAFQ